MQKTPIYIILLFIIICFTNNYATRTPTLTLTSTISATSLTLVNADTDQDIQLLANGATINLNTLPTRNLNVRANTNPVTVGSVRFALDGNANFRTESSAPYALAGDSNGDYHPWTPSLGTRTLTATPYTGASGSGTVGAALAITFYVIDQSTPTPESNWTRCSQENGFCAFEGTRQVRYGANNTFVTGTFTNGVQCTNAVFTDPAYGTAKYCEYSNSTMPTPTPTPTSSGAFLEQSYNGQNGGLFLVGMASATNQIDGGWRVATEANTTFLAATYDSFNNPNSDLLTYKLAFTQPGVYRFVWNNSYSGSHATDENDSWLKINNTSNLVFFGYRGSGDSQTLINGVNSNSASVIYPKGSGLGGGQNVPEGGGADGFFKVYLSGDGGFRWQAFTSDFQLAEIYMWVKTPQTVDVIVSNRSAGHKINRFAVFHIDKYGNYFPGGLEVLNTIPNSPRN